MQAQNVKVPLCHLVNSVLFAMSGYSASIIILQLWNSTSQFSLNTFLDNCCVSVLDKSADSEVDAEVDADVDAGAVVDVDNGIH